LFSQPLWRPRASRPRRQPSREGTYPVPARRRALDSGLALRVALALGLVIALGIGGVYALKRFLPGSLGGAAGASGASRCSRCVASRRG
jgi:hypothetical protein